MMDIFSFHFRFQKDRAWFFVKSAGGISAVLKPKLVSSRSTDIIEPFLLLCSTSRDNCAFPKDDVLAILLAFHQLHLFAMVAITSAIDCP
jgi:hypothetical protein